MLSNRLSALVQALELARRTRRNILENLLWATLYNGLMLPFAALGWVTRWAAVGMSVSSLIVVLNALRLTRAPVSAGCPRWMPRNPPGVRHARPLCHDPAALLLVGVAVYIFFWAVDSGQYDDLDGPAHSILFDDQDPRHQAAVKPDDTPGTPTRTCHPVPDLLPLLGSALVLGLLGGGHCLGMCGGLMGALTLAIP